MPFGRPGGPEMSAPVYRCGRFTFALTRPLVMGILNVTPDSFSDGGRYVDRQSARSRMRGRCTTTAPISSTSVANRRGPEPRP